MFLNQNYGTERYRLSGGFSGCLLCVCPSPWELSCYCKGILATLGGAWLEWGSPAIGIADLSCQLYASGHV